MELESTNKFSDKDKFNASANRIHENKSSDEMEEKTLSVEIFRTDETVDGFADKSTPERMDDEVYSNEVCEPSKPHENVININGKLPTEKMDDQTHFSACFEKTENRETVNDLTYKQSSSKMNDEIVSNESNDEMDIIENQTDSVLDCMKNSLLDCVAKSDGFFKSQQVGEPDLTFTEKREIAGNLLVKSLPLFLERYWKFIKIEDVPYFDAYKSNYDVNFYVNEILMLNNTKTNKVRIKNRRYEALKRMVDEKSYFSDAEMKKRNPFLYDQMIGRHLTEKERMDAYKEQYPDKNFSAFLLNQMEKNIENCLFEKQKNEDEAIVEEEDDDSEEEESELEDEEPVKRVVTDDEKKQLRSEFTNIMYESFLDGKDKDFDYSSVDNNVDFDSIHQRDIDEEEKYFDEESSHSSDSKAD